MNDIQEHLSFLDSGSKVLNKRVKRILHLVNTDGPKDRLCVNLHKIKGHIVLLNRIVNDSKNVIESEMGDIDEDLIQKIDEYEANLYDQVDLIKDILDLYRNECLVVDNDLKLKKLNSISNKYDNIYNALDKQDECPDFMGDYEKDLEMVNNFLPSTVKLVRAKIRSTLDTMRKCKALSSTKCPVKMREMEDEFPIPPTIDPRSTQRSQPKHDIECNNVEECRKKMESIRMTIFTSRLQEFRDADSKLLNDTMKEYMNTVKEHKKIEDSIQKLTKEVQDENKRILMASISKKRRIGQRSSPRVNKKRKPGSSFEFPDPPNVSNHELPCNSVSECKMSMRSLLLDAPKNLKFHGETTMDDVMDMAYDDGTNPSYKKLFSMLERLTNLRHKYKTADQIEEDLEKKIKGLLEGKSTGDDDDDDDDYTGNDSDDEDDSPVGMPS